MRFVVLGLLLATLGGCSSPRLQEEIFSLYLVDDGLSLQTPKAERGTHLLGDPVITEQDILYVTPVENHPDAVELTFTKNASQRLAKATSRHIDHPMAMFLGGDLINIATVRSRLDGRSLRVTNLPMFWVERLLEKHPAP